MPDPSASDQAPVPAPHSGADSGRLLDGAAEDPDPGLYRVLSLSPDATDEAIQVAYRREAAKLATSEVVSPQRLRELNRAYETLGNPTRRSEYDRLRTQSVVAGPLPPPARMARRRTTPSPPPHRRSTRRRNGPRTASSSDLLAVLVALALAAAAALLVVPRIPLDLSGLEGLGTLTGLYNVSRTGTPAPSVEASPVAIAGVPVGPSPAPSDSVPLVDQFRGSSVSMSSPTPARSTPVSVIVRLRRNGQPASDVDVFATVQYRTARERWPQTGAAKTDQTGATAITFNVGDATPGFEAKVQVTALVEGQTLTWATTFTPR